MRKTLKNMMCAMMAMVLAVGITVSPAMADEAHAAAKKPYMKSLNIKWDLKKGKTLKITEPYAGIGKKPTSIKIKNYKVANAKKGFKKLTFTIEVKRPWSLTKKMVHKAIRSSYWRETGSVGSGMWFALVDRKTGLDLERKNDLGVSVKSGAWKYSNYKKVTDSDGCWWNLPRKGTLKVTVTYPEDYKDLCLGIGGYNLKQNTKTDTAFWNGDKPFGKTSYYKKGKSNSHWMVVK